MCHLSASTEALGSRFRSQHVYQAHSCTASMTARHVNVRVVSADWAVQPERMHSSDIRVSESLIRVRTMDNASPLAQ